MLRLARYARLLSVPFAALLALTVLAGCENTIEGAKQDLKKADREIKQAIE